MEHIKEAAEQLQRMIKANEREIGNPALTRGILSELDFFIENIGDSDE